MGKGNLRAAIVGIGCTDYTKNSGRSTLQLAVEAAQTAMEDAGLTNGDIDGVLTHTIGDADCPEAVSTALALKEVHFVLDWWAGGIVQCGMMQLAANLVTSGACNNVLLYRSLNGRSGNRIGGSDGDFMYKRRGVGSPYRYPYGQISYGQNMAMWARRHMEVFGTKEEHLGAIAINQRDNAVLNERAMQREPVTLEKYMSARRISVPFRVYDMCLESDGACAVIVSSLDQAKDRPKKPVYIKAAQFWGKRQGGDWADAYNWPDLTENFTTYLSPRLYAEAGISVCDIDIAEIYDCFTHTVLLGIEGLGFCKKGEGGPFAASGAIRREGPIPVNTGGGMLSEAYIHGWNPIYEAVEQLRGESGGHQVPKRHEVAVVTSGATTQGSGMILTTDAGL
jgi:acetyl-CoA acetyltransferase